MSDHRTAEEILSELSPEALKLARSVMALERENLHIEKPSLLVSRIVEKARELTK